MVRFPQNDFFKIYRQKITFYLYLILCLLILKKKLFFKCFLKKISLVKIGVLPCRRREFNIWKDCTFVYIYIYIYIYISLLQDDPLSTIDRFQDASPPRIVKSVDTNDIFMGGPFWINVLVQNSPPMKISVFSVQK